MHVRCHCLVPASNLMRMGRVAILKLGGEGMVSITVAYNIIAERIIFLQLAALCRNDRVT